MAIEALPDAVREALARRGAKTPLEALPTQRSVPLPSLDGRPRSAPMWLVRAPGQLWLVAADDAPPDGLADAVAVAVGHPARARLDRILGRSTVVVDEVRAALGTAEAAPAARLLERFAEASGGPSYPFDPGLAELDAPSPGTGRVAPGAEPMPAGWLEAAGGAPDDPWLAATRTGTQVALAGVVRDLTHAVAVGVSERRARVVLLGAPSRPCVDLPRAPVHARRRGLDRLEGPGLELEGSFLGRALEPLARMAAAPPGRRWALAAWGRLEAGEPDDALALLREGLARGHEPALAGILSVFAAVVGDGPRAAGLLEEALGRGADPEDPDAFAEAVRAARGASAGRARAALDDAQTPAAVAPEGAPWPPRGADEIWAVGAIRPLGPVHALRRIDRGTDKLRALRWRAALTGGAPELRAAAYALRHAGRSRSAVETLARAQRVHPRAEEAWILAAWTLDDEPGGVAPLRALEDALALDPEAAQAARQLGARALARAAERARAAGLEGASALAEAADAHDPEASLDERLERARQVEAALGDARRAARMRLRVARAASEALSGRAAEDAARADLQPGKLRLQAARALLAHGDASEAVTAAREAVRDDFLHAEVLRGAADLRGLPVADAERRWWRHLAEVLAPTGAHAPGLPPRARLSAEELDGLQPRGRGWLADLRARISTPALPPRDHLVRGLERVESARYPELFRLVAELSSALGVDPVPTYVYRGDDAVGVSGWPVSPPVLLIGAEHLDPGPRHLDEAALRFAVAVELSHIAAGHPVLAIDDSLLGTSKSVYQAFGRFAGTAETAVDLIALIPGIDQLAKLQKILKLSRRVFTARSTVEKAHGLARPLLERVLPKRGGDEERGIAHAASSETAIALRLQADRAALLLTGDVGAAARALLATTSRRPAARLETLARDGLAPLLDPERADETVDVDEALRLAALLEEAARRSADAGNAQAE